jgi:hypothetical protein
MRKYWVGILFGLSLIGSWPAGATDYFVSPFGGNSPPFADWQSAATNIQDAIDAATDGDTVWVTNGVYANGGKAMAGDLTNRVVLDKALTVQSVNGPAVTTILGGGVTNGPAAVRCAWLTNGAVLNGFTIGGGATRGTGDRTNLLSGGGVWCASAAAVVTNCLISGNFAWYYGGGVYQGTVSGSIIQLNSAYFGGGTCQANMNHCVIQANSALVGGGVYQGSLSVCAIMQNFSNGGAAAGAVSAVLNSCTIVNNRYYGTYSCQLTNCIDYFNSSGNDTGGSTFSHCCTPSAPSGSGYITNAPQLLADGFHLASTSPCRGAGINPVSGTDIDGQPWANPPSIGCDEWQPAPIIALQPAILFTANGFTIGLTMAGQDPFGSWWTQNGLPIENDSHFSAAHTATLAATGVSLADTGTYQVVVSNAFGMVTSAVAQLAYHYVNGASSSPVPPYLSWDTAATNIQDAVDSASPGTVILVSNGVYSAGGRVMYGDLTNRVVLDKPIRLQSVNGPAATAIAGAGAIKGPSAVRCAWLTNGATLVGFTIRDGATRSAGDLANLESGGGVWCSSNSSFIVNCCISNNAAVDGGGSYLGNLNNCLIRSNTANAGAGTYQGVLNGCALIQNVSVPTGATYYTLLNNCTVVSNRGYGTYGGQLTNCVVYSNLLANYAAGTLSYCCTTPLPSGPGNISADPLLSSDGFHLSGASPCVSAGINAVTGTDIDGQPWASPPSIGCDELRAAPFVAQPSLLFTNLAGGFHLAAAVAALPQFACLWLKDGNLVANDGHFAAADTTNLRDAVPSPSDTGGYQLVVSNAYGMATSAVAQVTVHCVNATGGSPVPPYADWSTAATNIQDAIDAALAGEIVIVTNGVYGFGGTIMSGDLSNRVALNKAVLIQSVNGAPATIIQGAWDPVSTNGPLATRCVWISDGAVLAGFTIQGGATRNAGDLLALQSGGGVWASSTNTLILNCVICTNAASTYAGGAYQGRLSRCLVLGNHSSNAGGGLTRSVAFGTLVAGNFADAHGGGSCDGILVNCTLTGNSAGPAGGGGLWYDSSPPCVVANCILYWNFIYSLPGFPDYGSGAANWSGFPTFNSSCTTPTPSGNIGADPQLLDGVHITTTSPCYRAGNPAYAVGSDLDGEAWASPPSIGCDEIWTTNLLGPLSVGIIAPAPPFVVSAYETFIGQVTGRVSRVAWSFGDGYALTNASRLGVTHYWMNPGDYTLTFIAYNTDNPGGVSSNLLLHLVLATPPTLSLIRGTGTTFSVSFPAQLNVVYYLDETTNLTPPIVWRNVIGTIATSNVVQLTDSHATDPARFYRVRVP